MNEHPRGPELQAYLDSELAEEEAGRIARHARGCEACCRELEELRSLRDRLASHRPSPGPAPVWPRIAGRLAARRQPRRRGGFALATAAVCAFGIVLGVFLGSKPAPASGEGGRGASATAFFGGTEASLLDVYVTRSRGEDDDRS